MESSSSSDEDILLIHLRKQTRKRKRRFWVHPILQRRTQHGEFHRLIQELRLYHGRFRQYFRMSVEQFEALLGMLAPHIVKKHTNYRKPIDPEQRLAVCLRFLSTGDSFVTIASSFRLGVSTVTTIVKDICDNIWEQLKAEYMPVPTEEIWKNTVRKFQVKWNFPNCVGALDGKHVVIQKPEHSGSAFWNYKNTFSVVLLALVDADYKFIAVDVGAYGSNSDGGILTKSALGREADALNVPPPAALPSAPELGELPHAIVADEAFPLKTYMLKPYSGRHLPEDKRIFNYRLSRARRIVENAFGILSQRWRLYHRRIQLKASTVDSVIKATCILCNYLRAGADGDLQDAEFDEEEDGVLCRPALQNLRPLRGNRGSLEAMRIRDTLRQYFVSPAGMVPWQYPHVRRGVVAEN